MILNVAYFKLSKFNLYTNSLDVICAIFQSCWKYLLLIDNTWFMKHILWSFFRYLASKSTTPIWRFISTTTISNPSTVVKLLTQTLCIIVTSSTMRITFVRWEGSLCNTWEIEKINLYKNKVRLLKYVNHWIALNYFLVDILFGSHYFLVDITFWLTLLLWLTFLFGWH